MGLQWRSVHGRNRLDSRPCLSRRTGAEDQDRARRFTASTAAEAGEKLSLSYLICRANEKGTGCREKYLWKFPAARHREGIWAVDQVSVEDSLYAVCGDGAASSAGEVPHSRAGRSRSPRILPPDPPRSAARSRKWRRSVRWSGKRLVLRSERQARSSSKRSDPGSVPETAPTQVLRLLKYRFAL